MLRDTLKQMTLTTLAALQDRGDIDLPEGSAPEFDIERPQHIKFGNFSINVAMKLARPPKSREIAAKISEHLTELGHLVPAYDFIDKVEVAGPGFINIYIKPEWLLQQSQTIIAAGDAFGALNIGKGRRVNIEFVSANPTGMVHIGNGRGGFIGDTLGNVMAAAGYSVTKEYYFNDYGQQITLLGRSCVWYIKHILGIDAGERPSEGYFDHPAAVHEEDTNKPDPQTNAAINTDGYYYSVAQRVLEMAPEVADLARNTEIEYFDIIGAKASSIIMEDIKKTMLDLNIHFDVFFSQASLDETNELQKGIELLRNNGYVFEKDGAVWMETSKFGDDKDRVLVKSNGDTTYVASDVAYAYNKYNRGFDTLIYVLGADHYGYIGRMKAVAQMLGHSADSLEILIYQQVNLDVGGKSVRMSKRAGNIVNLDELAREVGADVTRFFYMMRDHNSHLDFNLELAKKESDENPGLSVQYAHARIAGVLRKSAETGSDAAEEAKSANMAALLNDTPAQLEAELELMRENLRMEEVIERIALLYEPHHLTKYAMDVAAALHVFYDRCPALRAENPEVRKARFALLLATKTILARTLNLLGMHAPDRMDRAE